LDLVKKQLSQMHNKGWLLDGYPRTTTQAKQLDEFLASINQPVDAALYIDVDANIIADRLKDRRVHLASGRTYHLVWHPPKSPDRDDVTGEAIERRPDDEPETVIARIQKFEEKIQPLLEYYKHRSVLRVITSPNSDIGYQNMQVLVQVK